MEIIITLSLSVSIKKATSDSALFFGKLRVEVNIFTPQCHTVFIMIS